MHRRFACPSLAIAVFAAAAPASGQRATGIDVSDWQTANINWTTVAKPVSQGGAGVSFAFIRSSRGGTTGTYNETTEAGTLSNRYDDLYFTSNITKAKAAGVLPGAYHFARPDIATNTGLDEANHFLEKAAAYMRPGFLRPVLDLEAGSGRTKTALTSWALEFSDRLFAVTGVRPLVYVNSSYANDEVDSRLNAHDLWLARPADPAVTNVQTTLDPPAASGYPNVYGVWNASYPTMPAQRPWDFWQYKTSGSLAGVPGANVDKDIANGDIEFVKDFLVPAMWTPNASGQWTTASNWNGVTAIPQPIDRVIVDRPAGTYDIALASGTHSVRSLQMNERFAMTGGSLSVAQYANFALDTTMSAGSLTAATLSNPANFMLNGGNVTAGTVTGIGHLSINGGTFTAGSFRQGSIGVVDGTLQLTGTNASLVVGLGFSGTGHIDIGAAKLILRNATTTDAARSYLHAGNILTTSGGPSVGVAYFLATDLFTTFSATFGGEPIFATDVLLTRAIRGDADFSGSVDFNDLVALSQNYGVAGRWRNGDFTYDGVVDFGDLVVLAQNYNASLLDTGSTVIGDGDFAGDWVLAQSLAPEPAMMLLASPALVLRRQRFPLRAARV